MKGVKHEKKKQDCTQMKMPTITEDTFQLNKMIDSKKKEENRKMRGWEKMWRRDMNRVKKKRKKFQKAEHKRSSDRTQKRRLSKPKGT